MLYVDEKEHARALLNSCVDYNFLNCAYMETDFSNFAYDFKGVSFGYR